MLTMEEISSAVGQLLGRLGAPPQFTIDAIPGGANNRVFRIASGGRDYFLKCYRRHPEEPLDRLGHDWRYSSFAWENGLRNVAQPLICDERMGLGLFHFVAGRRLAPYDIEQPHVLEAAAFFRALNRLRDQPLAKQIPSGFEAEFSVNAMIDRVEARVVPLEAIAPASPASELALRLVNTLLRPKWDGVRTSIERAVPTESRSVSLTESQRCLSPVDFGFHNALATETGGLLFHDFEYGGWDDPARMLCDFFCQLQLPAARDFADPFGTSALAEFPDADQIRHRATMLWPLFRISWCCAVLNDFLPPSLTRPRYAGQPPSELRKTRQLEMAELLVSRPLDDVPWTR